VFTVQNGDATPMLMIVQAPPLIGSSDVQDLEELVRVRRYAHGLVWAYDGNFSQAASRTCAEFGSTNLTLCTVLPPVHH
jgi:hypothetical protein